MTIRKIFHRTILLGFFNLIFMICGIVLLAAGLYLYMDTTRLLLSRLLGSGSLQLADLPQPLFYYIALGLSLAGMIAIFATLIGWWAICLNTYSTLSIYFLLVLFLLLTEFGLCLMITLWPHCLGLNLNEMDMVKVLQGNYGVPGKEKFTIAMDLAQTQFNCCAINSNINYDTSLWKLQEFGVKEWPVPLTCCHLSNRNELNGYLDPQPLNVTVCESLQRAVYENGRHTEGCLEKIDLWYRQHYVIFLGATLIVALIEFGVLLTIILNCTKLPKSNGNRTTFIKPDVTHQDQLESTRNCSITSTDYLEMPMENRDVYVQPIDLYKNSCERSFRPASKYQYQVSKSYLV